MAAIEERQRQGAELSRSFPKGSSGLAEGHGRLRNRDRSFAADTSLTALVATAKQRWIIERD